MCAVVVTVVCVVFGVLCAASGVWNVCPLCVRVSVPTPSSAHTHLLPARHSFPFSQTLCKRITVTEGRLSPGQPWRAEKTPFSTTHPTTCLNESPRGPRVQASLSLSQLDLGPGSITTGDRKSL